MSNLFIQIELEEPAQSLGMLVTICPVNIFAAQDGRVVVRADQLDECTLCELCLKAAPAGSVRISKLYSGEILVASAA